MGWETLRGENRSHHRADISAMPQGTRWMCMARGDSTRPPCPERGVCSTRAANDRIASSARLPSDKESGAVAVAEYAAKMVAYLGMSLGTWSSYTASESHVEPWVALETGPDSIGKGRVDVFSAGSKLSSSLRSWFKVLPAVLLTPSDRRWDGSTRSWSRSNIPR